MICICVFPPNGHSHICPLRWQLHTCSREIHACVSQSYGSQVCAMTHICVTQSCDTHTSLSDPWFTSVSPGAVVHICVHGAVAFACVLELWLAHMFFGAVVYICVHGALVCMCPWSHGPIEHDQSDHGHLGRLQCELVRGPGSRQRLSLISGDSGLPRLECR